MTDRPNQDLPGGEAPEAPARPDNELPKPDSPRPTPGDRPDHGLPGRPGDRPDQGLPGKPEPKK